MGKTAPADIVSIEDGKADTIVEAILKTLRELAIDLSKVVDDASVMMGIKKWCRREAERGRCKYTALHM